MLLTLLCKRNLGHTAWLWSRMRAEYALATTSYAAGPWSKGDGSSPLPTSSRKPVASTHIIVATCFWSGPHIKIPLTAQQKAAGGPAARGCCPPAPQGQGLGRKSGHCTPSAHTSSSIYIICPYGPRLHKASDDQGNSGEYLGRGLEWREFP